MLTQTHVDRLDKIVAYYARRDYQRMNPPNRPRRKDGSRKVESYSLSAPTNEAREMLHRCQDAVWYGKDDTPATEADVKNYLLIHLELWADGGSGKE